MCIRDRLIARRDAEWNKHEPGSSFRAGLRTYELAGLPAGCIVFPQARLKTGLAVTGQ